MGTSCGINRATGRWVLDCANCGAADGTVRKRRCPARTRRGLPYCPATQLCSACYALLKRAGTWQSWHFGCYDGAAASDAAEDAREREPALFARSARGDWAEDVPAGMVEVITYAGTRVLISKDAYAPDRRGFGLEVLP